MIIITDIIYRNKYEFKAKIKMTTKIDRQAIEVNFKGKKNNHLRDSMRATATSEFNSDAPYGPLVSSTKTKLTEIDLLMMCVD